MKLFHSDVKNLQKWFREHVKDDGKPYLLDAHQATIVLDVHKNCLVTARAGSGKTRTVVAKIVYLIAHEGIKPEEIIVFAFNRKARTEVNERLAKIRVNDKTLLDLCKISGFSIATTFHSFSFHLIDDGNLQKRIISEDFSNRLLFAILKHLKLGEKELRNVTQFITRAEQLYFEDYEKLRIKLQKSQKITTKATKSAEPTKSELYFRALTGFHKYLELHHLLNFNQLIILAIKKLAETKTTPYRYIFIDEYQDFSLLFLKLVEALRKTCPSAKLLAVGDDWQAINGFAGSDVRFFQHFEDYFPENCAKLFIPTNYRSGKRIVKNANYFMANGLKDYKDCKTGNKTKSHIHLINLKNFHLPPKNYGHPYAIEQTFRIIEIIAKSHPGQTIKILARNNELDTSGWSLEYFFGQLTARLDLDVSQYLSFSTIHRSKGLEADVVILLEINAGKFPKPPKTDTDLSQAFGETPETILDEEKRLFYVALTRPKRDLYIITNTPPKTTKLELDKPNFLNLLNPNWLEDFEI